MGRRGSKWKKTYVRRYRNLNTFCEMEIFHYEQGRWRKENRFFIRISVCSLDVCYHGNIKNSFELWHMNDVYTDMKLSEQKAANKHIYTGLSCLCSLVRVLIKNVISRNRDGHIQQEKKVRYLRYVNITILTNYFLICYISRDEICLMFYSKPEILRRPN
jgi:hypothetical protein